MNKNLALLALTGVLTLASCSGGGSTADVCATTATACAVTVNLTGVSSADFDVKVGDAAAVRQNLSNGAQIPVSKTGTQVTVTPVAKAGYTTPAAGTATVTTSTPKPSLSFNYVATPPSVSTYKLTVNVTGTASPVAVTVVNSSGTIVYTGNLSSGNSIPNLPNGTYTVTGAASGGMNAPATTVTINGADASATLAYTSTPATTYKVTVQLSGVSSTTITVNDANGFPVSAALTNKTVNNNDTLTLPAGTYIITPGAQAGFNTPAPKTIVVANADTGVSFNYTAVAVAPISLDPSEEIGLVPVDGVVIADPADADDGNGWILKADNGGDAEYFVKGQVRVFLNTAVGAGDQVEAYYRSTLPGSSLQKLDVQTAADGRRFVVFDSSMGAFSGSPSSVSPEGLLTQLWFRVNNVDTRAIQLIPDNMAPEPINPEADATRRVNRGNQLWFAGTVNFYADNKAIQDKPLVNDGNLPRVNAGFESVRYYLVPVGSSIDDNGGDNPAGLRRYVESIKKADVYTSKPIVSAGANGGGRGYMDSLVTAETTFVPGEGYVPGTKNIPDGNYLLYSITRDKLGNERPASNAFRFTVDNTAPDRKAITVNIVDDSPLPFPASPGYVSDYARINITGTPADLDGLDPNVATGIGIGVDLQTLACSFNDIDLFERNAAGTAFVNNGARFDSNLWKDGINAVTCLDDVKDLLGNYRPDAVNATTTVTVDNIDPTIDITTPDMAGTLRSGQLYRPEATVRDDIAGVRASMLFWDAAADLNNGSFGLPLFDAPALNDVPYADTFPLINPVEITRADRVEPRVTGTVGGVEWRLPSFDDQITFGGLLPNRLGVRGLVIDHAGNATLRTKSFNFTSDGAPSFALNFTGQNSFTSGVYDATNFPLSAAQKNLVPLNRNSIAPVPVGINSVDRAGDVTLELDARTVTPTGTVNNQEVVKGYGRFDVIDWQAIRNYMVTPAQAPTAIDLDGDLLNPTIPNRTDNLNPTNGGLGSNTGDPSFLAPNASNRTSDDLRADWNTILAPWLSLGISNTTDNDSRYVITNSLRNPLVSGDSKRYPVDNRPAGDTYDTAFDPKFDQMNGIVMAGDGDFIFFGHNLK